MMAATTRLTAATLAVPSCPQCGGGMHDNRGDKSPKGPDFRCKSADCLDPATGRRTALWARDLVRKQPAAANGTRQAAAPKAAPAPDVATEFERISRLHYKALRFVLTHEAPLIQSLGGDVAGAVAAMAATVFLSLQRPNGKH